MIANRVVVVGAGAVVVAVRVLRALRELKGLKHPWATHRPSAQNSIPMMKIPLKAM